MALHGFFTDEKERQALRDKIIVLEGVDNRDKFYEEYYGSNWTRDFKEMKVRNWDGEDRYLILDFRNEFMILVSPYSSCEIDEHDLYDDCCHDYLFMGENESFPGCYLPARNTFEHAVLSEAWSTPYYELLRGMVNSYVEEPKFRVITLCGSTRFKEEFIEVQKRLTLEGNIVISAGVFEHFCDDRIWESGTKEMLDEMQRKKIDMSNEIFVINKGGYIGESTRAEIKYALARKKSVRYFEPCRD